MTDRNSGFVVILEKDIREDDSQCIVDAIKMIKGVADVHPVVSNPSVHIGQSRERLKVRGLLIGLINQLDGISE